MERTTKAALVAMLAAANVAFGCSEFEVRIRGATGPHNEGDEGACTVFYFDAHGNLEGVGIWDGVPAPKLERTAA